MHMLVIVTLSSLSSTSLARYHHHRFMFLRHEPDYLPLRSSTKVSSGMRFSTNPTSHPIPLNPFIHPSNNFHYSRTG
jgi:hypothetical protein